MKTHPTKSILLIEDDPIDIDLIIRAFKKSTSHHHIEVVHNGNDVLALISSWELGGYSPALILLDMKLPQMNGIEILRILKSHPEFLCLPVVVFTSSTEGNDLSLAYELGANSYVIKPVDFEKLVSITTHISKYWCEINQLP